MSELLSKSTVISVLIPFYLFLSFICVHSSTNVVQFTWNYIPENPSETQYMDLNRLYCIGNDKHCEGVDYIYFAGYYVPILREFTTALVSATADQNIPLILNVIYTAHTKYMFVRPNVDLDNLISVGNSQICVPDWFSDKPRFTTTLLPFSKNLTWNLVYHESLHLSSLKATKFDFVIQHGDGIYQFYKVTNKGRNIDIHVYDHADFSCTVIRESGFLSKLIHSTYGWFDSLVQTLIGSIVFIFSEIIHVICDIFSSIFDFSSIFESIKYVLFDLNILNALITFFVLKSISNVLLALATVVIMLIYNCIYLYR